MPATVEHDSRVIVALDFADADAALALARRLDPARARVKVGKELFTGHGPGLVAQLTDLGFKVFLDLKFHDIPNTVAAACAAAAGLGVWMVNLHASGGGKMMRAARERLASLPSPPLLTAVTVLTSLEAADLGEIGCPGEVQARVLALATLAQDAGLDGVVCSPREAAAVRAQLGREFVIVSPGVRPAGVAHEDQKRVMTPREAIVAGADYIVVGRPITGAREPLEALAQIEAELGPPA